jgi:hypothetical protein
VVLVSGQENIGIDAGTAVGGGLAVIGIALLVGLTISVGTLYFAAYGAHHLITK